MKKLYFLLFPFLLMAQTHRFIYEVQSKSDSMSNHYEKYYMVLDINPTEVKYYPYSYLVEDSINKSTGKNGIHQVDKPVLKRLLGSDENFNYAILFDSYLRYSTKDKMIWNIKPDTKSIKNLKFQKATIQFGGRNWDAWFLLDNDFSEGPYKFHGLPGIISELNDSENNFIFTLLKMQTLSKTYDSTLFVEKFVTNKPKKITEENYIKRKIKYYKSPYKIYEQYFKKNRMWDAELYIDGKKIESLQQLRLLEQKVQDAIRKKNNPIERDKAIDYSKI